MSTILFNIIDKDDSFLKTIDVDYLWKSIPIKFKDLFISENLLDFNIDDSYNFRPDIVAYKVYNNDLYYPIILYSNNISTILQFRTDLLGTSIKYLDPRYINYILSNI